VAVGPRGIPDTVCGRWGFGRRSAPWTRGRGGSRATRCGAKPEPRGRLASAWRSTSGSQRMSHITKQELQSSHVARREHESQSTHVLDVGCWVLGVGCWVLGVGCWVLGVGCWVLGVGCWVLDVGCWVLGVECWVLGVGCRV